MSAFADATSSFCAAIAMAEPILFSIRKECPPGACACDRDALLANPDADLRVLRLTREEEKKLIAHIDRIASHAELQHLAARLQAQLGIALRITPSAREVRTARGFAIELVQRPGLCRKTRAAIPAAIRRCLDRHPEIAYAILDQQDLLGSSQLGPL
jgi:hypothetical protein